MDHSKIYISTVAHNASELAVGHGFGLEIAEYCTAYNMDEFFEETDAAVRKKLTGIHARILHAPFNELFPCAIDKKARALAALRYRQAITLAKEYGADKVVIHGGYNQWIYYPVWYVQESVVFWKEFLQDDPGVEIVLENVLEEEPGMLLDIVKQVNHPKLRLCLDIGHVNAYGKTPVMEWLEVWKDYLSHFHIHNNDGSWDNHCALPCGSIPMAEFIHRAEALCPDATFTLEVPEADTSVEWLLENILK
jgi:sugar phosphate isomerase/epimerase